ncbi:Transcription activator AMTR1 [Colletotrichum tropicale]|nr:Transcription activator AMTR1 [Colletotrichum tropicale]
MRSHHGCLTCRKRKLKCDEAKPTCGQCTKSDRECIFSQDTKFRHFDVQGLLGQGQEKTLAGRAVNEGLFAKDHVWIDIPDELTFVNITNPYEDDTTAFEDELLLRHAGDGLTYTRSDGIPPARWDNTLPTPPSQDLGSQLDTDAVSRIDCAQQPPREIQNTPDILLNDSNIETFETVSPPAERGPRNSVVYTPPILEPDDDVPVDEDINDLETSVLGLQLLRHFREGPGQWMDLFDTSAHFSCKIPIRATTRPLLKSAICALAAKHLSRTQSNNCENQSTRSARAPISSPTSRTPDWQYHAVRYYHQAIRCLKHAIALGRCDDTRDMDGGRHTDTFAAVAILCMYELMNAPGNAWKAHLTALPLYSASDGNLTGCSLVPIPQSPIKGPIFWSLARQDFLCAFISETQTRLNLDHVRLWQNFGLATDENSLLLPFSPFCTADIRASTDVDEDSKSNELLWLLGKVVNYITSGDGIKPEDYSRPAGQRMSLGVTQELLLQRWEKLEMELQRWYESLPPTFAPSARTKYTISTERGENVKDMEMIWYDIPMCAATMQSYHMACILLLVNRPQESTAIRSTVSARLRSYRLIQREVLRHGKEICGISLSDPPDAVRIHSVQPLFVAGQSFHERPAQELVLKLLSDIEKELGWATNYQVRKLTDEWKVNEDDYLEPLLRNGVLC